MERVLTNRENNDVLSGNEWTSDDERLRDDLEQIGIPIQPLQIENILDLFF